MHTSEDSDHFLVGTAVVGNTQAAIFIWKTVENGEGSHSLDLSRAVPTQTPATPGPGLAVGGGDVIPWMRLMRATLAWAVLIGVLLVQYATYTDLRWSFEWFATPGFLV